MAGFPIKDFRLKGAKLTERQRVAAVRKAKDKWFAQVMAVERDALRYRCLREHAWRVPGTFVALNNLPAEQFDAEIDRLLAIGEDG